EDDDVGDEEPQPAEAGAELLEHDRVERPLQRAGHPRVEGILDRRGRPVHVTSPFVSFMKRFSRSVFSSTSPIIRTPRWTRARTSSGTSSRGPVKENLRTSPSTEIVPTFGRPSNAARAASPPPSTSRRNASPGWIAFWIASIAPEATT